MADQPAKSIAAVDINNLDKEWATHPERVEVFGKKVARAKRAVSEAKQQLKVLEAETKENVRQNPQDYNYEKKPGEEAIKDLVELDAAVQEKRAEVIQKEFDHDILKAGLEALQHRKDALKDMVYLWGQTYFARPTERKQR